MRVYIINADRVIVVRQLPAKLSNDEIAVASLEELRAARLTGKRLLALYNGLPGPEKPSKVGGRERLLDRLWARMEALPDPKQRNQKARSKQAAVIMMLRRAKVATVDEVMTATGARRVMAISLLPISLASSRKSRSRDSQGFTCTAFTWLRSRNNESEGSSRNIDPWRPALRTPMTRIGSRSTMPILRQSNCSTRLSIFRLVRQFQTAERC
jgi:hypothetical protein